MSTYHDKPYLALIEDVLTNGTRKTSRTGVDTLSVFSRQMRFDLRDETIPMLTTKKMHTRSIIHELLWYLMGDGNINYLKRHNVSIWNEWANENNDLGPVYGVLWRKWPSDNGKNIDQIATLIHKLKHNPDDRRLLISAWNPDLLPIDGLRPHVNPDFGKQALPPCHYAFQCYARPLDYLERLHLFTKVYGSEDIMLETDPERTLNEARIAKYELSMMLNQRSCDVGLGVPFNIVQYSLLLRMLCEVVGMVPGEFIWNGGDVHIYTNHVEALTEQLRRDPYPSPTFRFARPVDDIDSFSYDDFIIDGYKCHSTIKMDVAV